MPHRTQYDLINTNFYTKFSLFHNFNQRHQIQYSLWDFFKGAEFLCNSLCSYSFTYLSGIMVHEGIINLSDQITAVGREEVIFHLLPPPLSLKWKQGNVKRVEIMTIKTYSNVIYSFICFLFNPLENIID